jgi:hypothetical protein
VVSSSDQRTRYEQTRHLPADSSGENQRAALLAADSVSALVFGDSESEMTRIRRWRSQTPGSWQRGLSAGGSREKPAAALAISLAAWRCGNVRIAI